MISALEWAIFAGGIVAGTLHTIGVVASIFGQSDYYPPGEKDWTFYALWGLSNVLSLSLVLLAYLQWGTLGLPPWTFPLGLALFVIGSAIAIAAGHDLGVKRTTGRKGGLRTCGWYRFSRNPQYIGYIMATIGYPLWTDALLVVPLAAIYLLWWFLLPLAEEPWLREQYGEPYERYAQRVPRYIGVETFRAIRKREDVEHPHHQS